MTDLPKAITRDQVFWAAIAARQDQTNQMLAQILDRLPERPAVVDAETVELREPAAQPEAAEPQEPDTPLEAPARPVRRTRKPKTVKETS
ncbi:hypothetical protein [Nonomuraea sp. NPDC003804]|uniref:hypothetical protein n=1 Tax=Nonomuraea sp. NPDC003804 TaxID=3154547 RepID=UPI0033B86472